MPRRSIIRDQRGLGFTIRSRISSRYYRIHGVRAGVRVIIGSSKFAGIDKKVCWGKRGWLRLAEVGWG